MRVYILNTGESGIDFINRLLDLGVSIEGVIGLSEREATDQISGYVYMGDYCKQQAITWTPVQSYTLKNVDDKAKLLALDIDLLIVAGWQRLIPEWFIEHCKLGVIGVHGSSIGITKGRGRSPQNWALIQGKTEFYVSIFRIDPGIDSGPIIDTARYPLTQFDDIATSQRKVVWCVTQMIAKAIHENMLATDLTTEQHDDARYLPQRLPEDGQIDWSRSSDEIYNFVRGLTRPYPGAFSQLPDATLKIWRCRPFDLAINEGESGEIIQILVDKRLIIRTGSGLLLIDDYEYIGEGSLAQNQVLPSVDFKVQMKTIIDRHYNKYPDLPVSEEIVALSQ